MCIYTGFQQIWCGDQGTSVNGNRLSEGAQRETGVLKWTRLQQTWAYAVPVLLMRLKSKTEFNKYPAQYLLSLSFHKQPFFSQ